MNSQVLLDLRADTTTSPLPMPSVTLFMELGKTYTREIPLTSAATEDQHEGPSQHKACTNADIDVIGARVNGRNRPNGG